METIVSEMMDLIANEVFGKPIERFSEPLSEQALSGLYKLSKSHDLAHLVGEALIKNQLIPDGEMRTRFQKQVMLAVYRNEKLNYELTRLCTVLNAAGIPFIPLKGSVLRRRYPEPWMRTSCDIDILIHESDLDRAVDLLISQMEYSAEARMTHDIGLNAPNGVHVELHFLLLESQLVGKADRVMETVWERCVPDEALPYCYVMPDELFYAYHIAHMAKHFVNGGCGIRPFLDIQVLNRLVDHDKDKRSRLLEECGLLTFAHNAEGLSEVWFGNAGHTEMTLEMQDFLLRGGVYGTTEKRITVQQVKRGGKFRYALHRIWVPYGVLKRHYPSLDGKPVLLPFYEVRRWFSLIFRGRVRRGVEELKITTATEMAGTREMLARLELVG